MINFIEDLINLTYQWTGGDEKLYFFNDNVSVRLEENIDGPFWDHHEWYYDLTSPFNDDDIQLKITLGGKRVHLWFLLLFGVTIFNHCSFCVSCQVTPCTTQTSTKVMERLPTFRLK